MDLGTCPKCGVNWPPESELCGNCGFVPIGAGLRPNVKKKKKKPKPYREPGASTPFLLMLVGFMTLGTLYEYEPWRNDWEPIRVLFGEEPSKPMDGKWEIVKSVLLGEQSFSPSNSMKGVLEFSESGLARLQFVRGERLVQADGRYSQRGAVLSLNGLSVVKGEKGGLPPKVALRITWLGEDSVMATVADAEALYLDRLEKGERARQYSRYRYRRNALEAER